MTLFEITINCITAIGAIATAGAFLYVVKGQKGTQKQVDSLAQMATMFTRHYQMARIQAGNTIYPKINITLKDDTMWGLKIVIKNNSYPIEIYRFVINTGQDNSDVTIKPREEYIRISQGEPKPILPSEIARCSVLYGFNTISIRLFLITPFEEAYEVRYSVDGDQEPYQSEPIPILFSEEEHKSGGEPTFTVREHSIRGNLPGTVADHFPEISKDSE